MDIFLVHLFNKFVDGISAFLRHWYVDSFNYWAHLIFSFLEDLDQTFAIKITMRHFFEPLFQDRTIFGYIAGPIFRFFRLIGGFLVYGAILIFGFIVYVVWAIVPIFMLFKAMDGNFKAVKWF